MGMRLRHRKWTEPVLKAHKDIGMDLTEADPSFLKTFPNVEIGAGEGGFLLALSQEHPDERFLGVEINRNAFAMAVKHGAEAVEKGQAKNFFFLQAPIQRIFSLFPDASLDHLYINFPDPWPKKKHHRRRLSYPPYLKEYYRMLKPGGVLYFRTDNSELFEDSQGYFQEDGEFDVEVVSPFDSTLNPILPTTEYETKFRARGVTIHLLIARKKANP